ncbi:MAG: type II secretion system protein [Candidatus Paceibacterota bacterium]|jgi:prepilin-type N-terminal cleavage/methylation domain-containing protein
MIKRGFTLIETVVVIAISVIALAALVNLFLIFNTTYGNQQAFMAAAGSAGGTMNALEAAIMPADHVLTSHNFSGTTYSSNASTLVLSLPAVNSSGNIITGTEDYIVFYASSANLYRLIQAGAGSSRVSGLKQLSTTLSALSFTYDDADFTKVTNVTVDIVTQAQFKQETVQGHLNEQIYLRNFPLTP